MEKTSKIKHVEMLQSWSNEHGTYYPHKVTFENGDIAIANKKKQNAYSVGQELKYEITGQDKADNNKFKEVKEEYAQSAGGYNPKQKGSNASFALSYSKDLAVAHINNGKEFKAEEILKVADVFNKWLNSN